MRVLVACECSGIVREAFNKAGHDAVSCDIKPSEDGGNHIQGDVLPLLREPWDMVIAFPPCTDLANVNSTLLQAKWDDGRTEAAAWFFMACYDANAPKVCVENPAGRMGVLWRRPDQYIQPWMWGEDYMKRTGLWLRGLPILLPEISEYPGALYWHSNGDVPAGKVPGKANSATDRSRFWPQVARAMVEQWGTE